MLVAFAVTVLIGVLVSSATVLDARLRIADDVPVAALITVSGATAGWALFDTVAGLGADGLDAWDVAGALLGSVVIAFAAWRGRRVTYAEHDLTAPTAAE